MIEINIGALVALLGIPTAVTGFCFWLLEHRIQKREKQKEAEEAKRQKEAAARERAREDLQIITIQGTSAAIALGEATAGPCSASLTRIVTGICTRPSTTLPKSNTRRRTS